METPSELKRTTPGPAAAAVNAADGILHLPAERDRLRDALRLAAGAVGAAGARIWWRVRDDFPVRLWSSIGAPPIEAVTAVSPEGAWAPVWTGAQRILSAAADEMPAGSFPCTPPVMRTVGPATPESTTW